MRLDKFNKVLSETPEDVKMHVKFSMDILDRIHELLEEKFDGKQKALAEKMGKSEAEVSKWLSGVQNFTTKTLVKLELAFGEPIVAVCTNRHEEATFEQVILPRNKEKIELFVGNNGLSTTSHLPQL